MAIQMGMSGLDLAGVALLGLIGALAVTTVQSQPPPDPVSRVASFLGIQDAQPQYLMAALAVLAALLLITRSILSTYLLRRVYLFLASRQAQLAGRLARSLFNSGLLQIQRRSLQETGFALIQGTTAATVLQLGQLTVLLSEGTLLVVLGITLLVVDPIVALATLGFFGLVAVTLHKAIANIGSRVGAISAAAEVESLESIQQLMTAYRELWVLQRQGHYVGKFERARHKVSKVAADKQVVALASKYVFEVALVLGGITLALYLFATEDAVLATGTLVLFLAAASRISPSLLRLQGAAFGLRSTASIASSAFELSDELLDLTALTTTSIKVSSPEVVGPSRDQPMPPANLEFQGAGLAYPGNTDWAFRNVSLTVKAGETLALVGPTGAGKSSLADSLLGLVTPTEGSVLIGGLAPTEIIRRWPGYSAYVPQSVGVFGGSLRQNIALGLPDDEIDDDLVMEILNMVGLDTEILAGRDGLDTHLGDFGVKLSGGQRQRLGIARALSLRPKLIVLDEATSSLDALTESKVSEAMANLRGSTTTVTVAHRLSTVRTADVVAYVSRGQLISAGSFEEVRSIVPDFDRQARLMGLSN